MIKQNRDTICKSDTSRTDHMINSKNHVIDFNKSEIIGRDINRK